MFDLDRRTFRNTIGMVMNRLMGMGLKGGKRSYIMA